MGHIPVHRLVNNCTDHAGCGFEYAVPVRSDPQTSEWHSYFENDVLVSEFAFFLQYIYIILMLESKGPKSGTINK